MKKMLFRFLTFLLGEGLIIARMMVSASAFFTASLPIGLEVSRNLIISGQEVPFM
jgi:hypothetical protein